MNNIPDNDEDLNDADITTLFASNKKEPSKELDKQILDNALLSQYDLLPQQRETFTKKYAPVIGTAAVLMIAIGLTPLTMNKPESTPELAQGPAPTKESAQAITADSVHIQPNQRTDTNDASIMEEESIATINNSGTQSSAADSASDETKRIVIAEAESTLTNSTTGEYNAEIVTAKVAPKTPDSISDESVAPNDSADTEIVASASTAQDSTPAVTTLAEPATEVETDAIGVDEDENVIRLPDKLELSPTAPANNSNEELLLANGTIIGSAETEASIGDNIGDSKDPLSTTGSVKIELSTDQELSVVNSMLAPITQNEKNDLPQSNTATITLVEQDNGELTSTTKPLDTIASQSRRIELRKDQILRRAEQESFSVVPSKQTVNKTVRIAQAQNQEANIQAEQDATRTDKPARVKSNNYRSSALLWIIEIKHLYKENEKDQARAELILFRKKFPDNNNERLLPIELLDAELD